MVFSSFVFLFRFLPIVLALYYIAPKQFKNLILFISSLFFYAWGERIYVFLMIFSTIVDYTHGRLVHRFLLNDKKKWAKITVASSVIINLLLLGFFKYSDFLIGNINALFHVNIEQLNLALPIGISFYTFQTMSYTIDIYRGEAKVQKNIISFGAYVALFPQLIAGPIVQYKTVDKQLNSRRESIDGFAEGVRRFIVGLGKKVLFANNIGYLWEQISAQNISNMSVVMAWIGAIAFSFQIYYDFSGYSDMAIGLGKMFGFNFNENFNYPYKSKSITEFWRRWHISLGTWFKEYVYIPLGGNHGNIGKQIRNIAIVWALTGIWHGASWNFLIWGIYFCILLILEKIFLYKMLEKVPGFFRHIYTLLLVAVSWMIFAFDKISDGIKYIRAMFGGYGSEMLDKGTLYILSSYGIFILVLCLASTDIPKNIVTKLLKRENIVNTVVKVAYITIVFLICISYLVDASYNPFLYFRF